MPNNLFLSWSGKAASLVAACFYEKLTYIINEARIFYSKDSITKDQSWFERIEKELKEVKAGIIFLTRENIHEPWILFEAGALLASSKCCVVCSDFSKGELGGLVTPLSNLNATDLLDKEDILRLVKTLRDAMQLTVPDKILIHNLDQQWPELQAMLREVLANQTEIDKPISDVNVAVPAGLIGRWHLSYKPQNGEAGGEDLEIAADGKYSVPHNGDLVYYFHIIALQPAGNNIVIQKMQVFDGKISESVHTVESLHFQNDGLISGRDTLGNTLKYERR